MCVSVSMREAACVPACMYARVRVCVYNVRMRACSHISHQLQLVLVRFT